MLPRLALPPVPSLPPPFPQNTLLVPYPIIIPVPVPVPIPLPFPLPAGMLNPSTHAASAFPTRAHTPPPPTDEGAGALTGVRVKAEDAASPYMDANDTHVLVTEAGSTHSEGEVGERKEGRDAERESEEEDVEADEEEEENDKLCEEEKTNRLVNGQRQRWRERRGGGERKVIQCLTAISVPGSDSEAKCEAGEKDSVGEPAGRSSGQHSPAHTANTNTSAALTHRHTLSPHTHVIHLTHTAHSQAAQSQKHTQTHTHSTTPSAAVLGLSADPINPLHTPRIAHTNSSHTPLPTMTQLATSAVTQTVTVPTDLTPSKLSPSPVHQSPESPSGDPNENRTGRCHELTNSQVSESNGSEGGAEQEFTAKDEEDTDCQQQQTSLDKRTHTLKRPNTQMQPHTPPTDQQLSEDEVEEKRCCLQTAEQNT